ncbi:MAG TPA: hypothetical protein ENJ79_03955 [Gammaproteobacteria bacterium]|nr:hypothetical protein [Gammaproteobacteria bacterium]
MAERSHCTRVRNLVRANILLGLGIAAMAFYRVIVGEYASLAERQQAEGLLNTVILGGLVYSALNWFIEVYLQPRVKACLRHRVLRTDRPETR